VKGLKDQGKHMEMHMPKMHKMKLPEIEDIEIHRLREFHDQDLKEELEDLKRELKELKKELEEIRKS
jgi:hypothetical protein